MLTRLWRCGSYRGFSKSVVWRDLEKKPAKASSSTSGSQGVLMARMPSEFEKKILVYSGRYKTVEEIPELVTSETLDRAKSKIRIKVGNILILITFIACGAVIYEGKASRKGKVKKWQEAQDAEIAKEEQKIPAQKH